MNDDYYLDLSDTITISDSDYDLTLSASSKTDTVTIDAINDNNTFTYRYSMDDTIVLDPPQGKLTVGKHTITEDKLGKLLALLDIIEGANESELHTLLNMQSALNKIGGNNGQD